MKVSVQRNAPASFNPGEGASGTDCLGAWLSPIADLSLTEKSLPFPGMGPRFPVHPCRKEVTILTQLPRLPYDSLF